MNNIASAERSPYLPTEVNLDKIPVSEDIEEKYKRHLSSFTQSRVETASNVEENFIFWQDVDRNLPGREIELQWWYGTIKSIENDQFEALVQDLSGRISNVTFDVSIVAPDDMDLLIVGNTFTYCVSRVDSQTDSESTNHVFP